MLKTTSYIYIYIFHLFLYHFSSYNNSSRSSVSATVHSVQSKSNCELSLRLSVSADVAAVRVYSTLFFTLLYSPLPLLFMPLFHGIRWCAQLKITAKFCKWRWRRRRHLNEMLRTLPGQWRHDSTHSHTHTHIRRQTDAKTDAHSSQRIMMPGRRRCG